MTDIDLKKLNTEKSNEKSKGFDCMSTSEQLDVFLEDNDQMISALRAEKNNISKTIDLATDVLKNKGRVFYIGSGTSGRLGVLDASEVPPTFGVTPNTTFIGIIAGGDHALRNSIEGVEDNKESAISDLNSFNFSSNDILIGVAASGRTPYVLSALDHAKSLGSKTALIACNKEIATIFAGQYDAIIAPDVGSEIIAGSTRLKSGTATKIILNQISTIVMTKLGYVYDNLMINVATKNEKLRKRAVGLVEKICHLANEDASKLLKDADMNAKIACVMYYKKCTKDEAQLALETTNNNLRPIITAQDCNQEKFQLTPK